MVKPNIVHDFKRFLKNPYIGTSVLIIIYLQFSSIVLDYFPKKFRVFLIWSLISIIFFLIYWYLRRIRHFNKIK